MKKVAYVPIKLHNERFPGKNIKPFDNGLPLTQYVFRTLDACIEARIIDEAYCFCSTPEIKEFFPLSSSVKYLRRSKSLDTSSTTANEIMSQFIKAIYSDIYVLVHVTCPFTSKETVKYAIDVIEQGRSDSAIPCRKIQSFLFDKSAKPVNFDLVKIPRTQDLDEIFEPTTGLWAFSRGLAETGRTIGNKPELFTVNALEAIDIDYIEDFNLANLVLNGMITLDVKKC